MLMCQLCPILFPLLDGKTSEEFAFTVKVDVQGGEELALAETARTAQKIITSGLYQTVNDSCLVDMDISVFMDFLEVFYSDGVDSLVHVPCFF